LSEAFWPNLQQSLPALGWCGSSGSLENYQLNGPLNAEFAPQSKLPEWLGEYDLVAPITAFALPRLRQSFPSWMKERVHRSIFVLPLLLGEEPQGWRGLLNTSPPFDRLMLFMPPPMHYERTFSDHTKEEWSSGAASALWNLQTGTVVYADGIHTAESLQKCGQPLERWLNLTEP
jgi:hypothetical protein